MTPLVLEVPGDKSIAHRALIFGALAHGESRVSNLPDGADVASTLAMMRALGAEIGRTADQALVRGRGAASLRAPADAIDCGNSGTTARLGMGLAAALPGATTFTGDASLRARPMARVVDPLRAMGARIDYLESDGRLPLRVTGGSLGPIEHTSAVASAQVKSALLLAGVAAGVAVVVREPALSRDHTERMLRTMGAALRSERERVTLDAATRLEPLDMAVPGDVSSAAFLIAAALLAHTPVVVRSVGVNPTRTGFLDIVRRMGARIALENAREQGGEPVADVRVEPSTLVGTSVGGAEVVRAIDELPLVAVLGARAGGETVVSDAAELRAKESDRIRALCENLDAVGVDVEERADGFRVRGGDGSLAGSVRSFGDHRIAMAFAVLGVSPGARVAVDDMDVARVSFPGFGAQLERVRAGRATIGGAA